MLSMLYNKMTHTRKHRGGNEVPDYVVNKTLARTAAQIEKNKEHARKIAEKKAEKKRKFDHDMAHPRRSTRVRKQKKNYDGGRRTRRNRK